jgi:hypothetical protein
MKYILLLIVLIASTTAAEAKIYKWVDENGSVHFSDRPYSREAKEIQVRDTVHAVKKTESDSEKEVDSDTVKQQSAQEKNINPQKPTSPEKTKVEKKVITEEDYRITSSVGKLGADIMSISGRISSGPKCKNMSVTATARNDNGLSATVTDNISKPNSFGSTIFNGNAKVSGSEEDYGFWKVDSVVVRCNDNK